MATSRKKLGPSRSDTLRDEVIEAKPDLNPGDRVLLDEACRLVDRLDRFEALLAGEAESWATIRDFDYDRHSELVVSSLVSESRQHTSELRQIVKALGLGESSAAAQQTVSELDRLRERRQA